MRNNLTRSEIIARIRAMITENIQNTGLHIQGVMDNPPFYYTIGLLEEHGFEIFNMGLPHEAAFGIFNVVHAELKKGMKIEVGKVYSMENTRWARSPIKFIKADHPLLFDKWCIQAREWWQKEFPVYQMVFTDHRNIFPGDEGFDEFMGQIQQLLVAKK